MTLSCMQNAVRFLAALKSAAAKEEIASILSEDSSAEGLVRCAAELGYDLDQESIEEAFRARMLVRELARRRRIRSPAQSPSSSPQPALP